ncbi:DUF6777 domain-containing protein [Streptomyces sp. NPDC086787]|uniref:DUF6777 domain-containing protein n=1 Tax=Streptomyces sp. NPDC086787 TaxID=3365759 RepID=UPI0038186B56
MSVDPPSSGRPTGPPSGPLSGPPPRPPSGGGAGGPSGPSGPGGRGGPIGPGDPGGPGSAGGGPGAPQPHRPWWRSAPRVALLTTAVVAAVIVAVVLSRPGGGGTVRTSEVFLQAADKAGPDPFTRSTARDASVAPLTPSGAASAPPGELHSVRGGEPGLYAGTPSTPSCDVEQQIKDLQADPAKDKAFASVAGVGPSAVPAHLRSLTPVQLRVDTRVTDHGYRDGAATSYQAVLQAGTAVLVDDRGMPRVRCASGNPLTPPVAQRTAPKTVGAPWPSYRPSAVVVVQPAEQVVKDFTMFDSRHDDWFKRRGGDHTAHEDRPTSPPAHPVDPWATPASSPPASSSSQSSSSTPSEESSPSSSPPSSAGPNTPPSGSPATEPPTDKTTSEPSSGPTASAPAPSGRPSRPEEPAPSPPSSIPSSAPSAPAADSYTPGESD